jgi:hypothetical protein
MPSVNAYKSASAIYQTIFPNQVVTTSQDVVNNHKNIIANLLEFPSGSTTIDLWNKLDFFYFFDGDNDILKKKNWVDSTTPTAELRNDSTSSFTDSYTYTSKYQPDIASAWWDNPTTKEGSVASTKGSRTKYYVYKQVDPSYKGPVIDKNGIVNFITSSYSSLITNTGSTPDVYFDNASNGQMQFTYLPNSNLERYYYKVQQISGIVVKEGTASLYLGPSFTTLVFNNSSSYINDDTITKNNASSSFFELSSSFVTTYNSSTSPFYPKLSIKVTQSSYTTEIAGTTTTTNELQHIITLTTASRSPNALGYFIFGPPKLGQGYSNELPTSFINLPLNTLLSIQEYITDPNNAFLTPTLTIYDTYRTNLSLNNPVLIA